MNTGKVLRVGGGHLFKMVVGDCTRPVVGINSSVARGDVAVVDQQVVFTSSRTHIMDTEVTASDGTIPELDGIGNGVCSGGTADRGTGCGRGVGVVRCNKTVVELDVRATVATHDNRTGSRGVVLALDGQVLESVILDIHQRDGTEDVSASVGAVVRQDDRVLVVTLEGDGVHR